MGAPIERTTDDFIILVSAPVSRGRESYRMMLIESLAVGDCLVQTHCMCRSAWRVVALVEER